MCIFLELVVLGRSLGTEGQWLIEFATEQQKLQRVERIAQREAEMQRLTAEREAEKERPAAEDMRLLAEKQRLTAERDAG